MAEGLGAGKQRRGMQSRGDDGKGTNDTLLRDDQEVAVGVAQAAMVHGPVGGVHVDGVTLPPFSAAPIHSMSHV